MAGDGAVAILLRRWYIAVVGAVCTVAALVLTTQAGGLHWARVELTFVLSAGEGALNPQLGAQQSLVPFAAAVEQRLNSLSRGPTFTSSSAPIHAAGIRDGRSIRLMDVGGQWQRSFPEPVLIIEVVASDPERLEAELEETLREVEAVSSELQAVRDVPEQDRIGAEVAPPERAYISAQRSGTVKAWIVLLLLGSVLTLDVTRLVDRSVRRRLET